MDHLEKLAGEWVEIREREGKDELVLMRADADVPATRGGRRQLDMNAEGKVRSLAQGASDRMETTASGDWDIKENVLELNLEGWEGTYDIENITDTELILKRR